MKKKIFGVGITDAKKEEILKYIINSLQNSHKNYYIVTPNPEMVVYATTHPEVQDILNGAEIALCDGVGIFWGAQAMGIPLQERFTGVELMEKLCEKANNQPITVGFLGGKPGVAELTADCLANRYPNLKVVFADSNWSGLRGPATPHPAPMASFTSVQSRHSSGGPSRVTPSSHNSSIDILFVALGFPKQEKWMAEHLHRVPVKVMVGVGGAFDYLSGRVPRAPRVVRSFGMEWLFRLIVQPWRIKRQLALPKFAWMVLKEKFSSRIA